MGGLQLTAVDAAPFRLERSKLVPFAQGMVSIPTTVAIIQHAKHGLVLWDTGVNHGGRDVYSNSRHSSSAANQAKPSQAKLEDPRKHFHLARAIYTQSGHCDFISQVMLQAKAYCVPPGASNCLKPKAQFQQRWVSKRPL